MIVHTEMRVNTLQHSNTDEFHKHAKQEKEARPKKVHTICLHLHKLHLEVRMWLPLVEQQ